MYANISTRPKYRTDSCAVEGQKTIHEVTSGSFAQIAMLSGPFFSGLEHFNFEMLYLSLPPAAKEIESLWNPQLWHLCFTHISKLKCSKAEYFEDVALVVYGRQMPACSSLTTVHAVHARVPYEYTSFAKRAGFLAQRWSQ